jgi:anti-sigma regulatory factor (Ser/Thr protein kinase)
VLHAYRGREPGRVRVTASMVADLLTLVVADDGVGMSPNPNSPGLGAGLTVVERLAERVEVQSASGTRLLVCLRLVAAASGGVPE